MFEDRLVASYVLRQFMLFDEGNTWTAFAHIITGVIGSGVLSLSWSVAQLGWVAAPISLVLFAFVTLLSAYLLSNLHLYPNPSNGVAIINRSYLQAGENILGNLNGWICSLLVYFNLFKLGVVYRITSAVSIRAIEQSNCYHEHSHEAACEYGLKTFMSFAYSLIGSGLGLAQTIGMDDWIPIFQLDGAFGMQTGMEGNFTIGMDDWIPTSTIVGLFVSIFAFVGSIQGLVAKRFG